MKNYQFYMTVLILTNYEFHKLQVLKVIFLDKLFFAVKLLRHLFHVKKITICLLINLCPQIVEPHFAKTTSLRKFLLKIFALIRVVYSTYNVKHLSRSKSFLSVGTFYQ